MEKQNVSFGNVEGFMNWLESGVKKVVFPFGANGWNVEIESADGDKGNTKIVSAFYTVETAPPYGAPKIKGIVYSYGDFQASGVVEFGFEDGDLKIINRRRVTEGEEISDESLVLGVFNDVELDRLDQPVAVVVNRNQVEEIQKMNVDTWLKLFDEARDGTEMAAVRFLRQKLLA